LEGAKERLGHGQGVRAEWVAGLEDPGHPGVGLEHLTQPMGEQLELLGPSVVVVVRCRSIPVS
jgi:hypothetical protein